MQKGQVKGEAVPFILIHEKKDNTGYEFELHRQAVEIFTKIRNKKIAVAAVAGPQRSGKSFLSNRLLKRMKGFAIGPSTTPCTKGLWIWGQPIQITEDTVLIIMDTEGLNSVQRDATIDLKIFSLSILLSSVFIYNSLGHIDQKALECMSYVLKVTQNLRMKSQQQQDSEVAKCFPYFYWVLRDFALDLKGMTENQYLEMALKPLSNNQQDPKNQIRNKIRKLFAQRRCECFPRPLNEEDKLARIEELQYNDLREKFRDKMAQFQRTFYETLPTKSINGKPLTGEIYLNLVREYLEAINAGRVPQVLNSLQRVLESEARHISESMQSNYKQAMSKVAQTDTATDESWLQQKHRDFVRQIESKLDDKFKNFLDVGRTAQYKQKLMESLEKDYNDRVRKNAQLSQILCASEFNKYIASYQLPELPLLQVLTDSLIKEKFQQFVKKIQPYFSKCKTPRKFTYFSEKFPKAIFEYFDLLIVRIKTLYTNELNKLKIDGKSLQSEIDSVRRILQGQEQLLTEKQKEIEALTHEKETYRRQMQKMEKMKQFEKETESMGKSQLKKSLESYKAQAIELQNRNEQLEEQLQRLKNELNGKKSQLVQLTRKNITDNDEKDKNSTGNVPNELITVMSILKDKLTAMREFYESKMTDYVGDERQIEQMRTEKHITLQKTKQELRGQKEQARRQINRIKQQYERKLQLLNQHLDDIKANNMELERRQQQTPGREHNLKNFVAKRKMLEESLRLKQNNINILTALTQEQEQRINKLKEDCETVESSLAMMRAERANFESYKETFPFILRESLNWVMNKNNKLKHSIKTLTQQDFGAIRNVFKELNLSPF